VKVGILMEDTKQDLFNRSMIAQLIKIEKDIRKLIETNLVLIQQTIQGNKMMKKSLFMQFNVKDLTDVEVAEEYAKMLEIIEKHSDDTKNLAEKLMLGSPI
jgi:hypothetical protein